LSDSARSKPVRPRLPPAKGAELTGIVLLLLALLLGLSFISYHPEDPSLLFELSGGSELHNLVGPIGAQLSAVAFGIIGLCCLFVPVLLGVAGWRRVRRRALPPIAGRGVGAVVVVLSLPGLLQLTFGKIGWRGLEIDSGGAVGRLLASGLTHQLGFTGALLVCLGVVAVGAALLVQSTLEDLLLEWTAAAKRGWERLSFSWSRRKERERKSDARRRVVAKHMERVAEHERPVIAGAGAGAAPPPLDLPMRVTRKEGEPGFAIRRVKVEPEVVEAPAPRGSKKAAKKKSVRPQQRIAFPQPSQTGGETPPLNLLNLESVPPSIEEDELVRLGEVIRERCAEFGVEGTIEGISPGPVITVFEFQPAPGVKVSQIVNLQDDLALVLKAESVRIDRMPGRSTLGIDVPNDKRAVIRLGHLLSQPSFTKSPSALTMALGTTIYGDPYFCDLATMPHLLVAGATGSGKSVGLQSMITSMVYKATRDHVQFIFIDPKRIELGVYRDIPHLKAEVVVEPKLAANALRWAVAEMERRYRLLAEVHVRSIDFYNRAIEDPEVQKRLALSDNETEITHDDLKPLPYYVVVIDELADLMMVASSDVEASIARLAQMARAVGIHLIVATQRPSVDVLTGTIKANFPCRIAYATATRHDSRTILDQIGAEKLLGKGDMLFMAPGTSRVMRLHGALVTEQETAALVRWLKKSGKPEFDPTVLAHPEEERGGSGGGGDGDELFDDAARLVVAERQASASFLQRRMRIGFSRAARLVDIMEREGLLGPPQGSKPREVLVPKDYFSEVDEHLAQE
jgi:S-DNA-T family DNA segregation ATPase FtsK/SpoIIIE